MLDIFSLLFSIASRPKHIRDLGGFKGGEKIAILAYDDRIKLRPIKQVDMMHTEFASKKSHVQKTGIAKRKMKHG